MKRDFLEAVFDYFPVDDFPKIVQMVGSSVLIIQIVGMFPDIEAQERFHALSERITTIGFLHDDQLAVSVQGEPSPSRAEEAGGSFHHLVLEVIEVAEIAFDGFGQLSLRFQSFGLGVNWRK